MSKFMSSADEALYEITLNGFHDDERGSVDELGWFGLLLPERAIVSEDSQGFVEALRFDTVAELQKAWHIMLDAYEEWENDNEQQNT